MYGGGTAYREKYTQHKTAVNSINNIIYFMSFSKETIKAVWEKADISPDNSKDEWRKDQCSAWIFFDSYGNRDSDYGWEIDHITPSSKGGSDNLSNLRPLQWNNNASRQDDRLVCKIKSAKEKNVNC